MGQVLIQKGIGAGESGKSTLLKQLRLIHTAGFDAEERESYRAVVFSNIIMEMQTLFEAMRLLNISFEEESNKVKDWEQSLLLTAFE